MGFLNGVTGENGVLMREFGSSIWDNTIWSRNNGLVAVRFLLWVTEHKGEWGLGVRNAKGHPTKKGKVL